MMAGAFIMNGWLTFTSLKGVSVERVLPERAMAGDMFSVEVTLKNRKRFLSAWLMSIIDHGERQRRIARTRGRLHPCPRRRGPARALSGSAGPARRIRLWPVHVDTRFPLGLVERGVNLSRPGPAQGLSPAGTPDLRVAAQADECDRADRLAASHSGHSTDEFSIDSANTASATTCDRSTGEPPPAAMS